MFRVEEQASQARKQQEAGDKQSEFPGELLPNCTRRYNAEERAQHFHQNYDAQDNILLNYPNITRTALTGLHKAIKFVITGFTAPM
jgi:hypothetical protein